MQCIAVFPHYSPVTSACLTQDERYVVTTSEDGVVRSWDAGFDPGLSIAERILEFEVRSATALEPDGQVRALERTEWEEKSQQLLDVELK